MLDENATNLASYELDKEEETSMAESRPERERMGGRYEEMVKGGSPWANKRKHIYRAIVMMAVRTIIMQNQQKSNNTTWNTVHPGTQPKPPSR